MMMYIIIPFYDHPYEIELHQNKMNGPESPSKVCRSEGVLSQVFQILVSHPNTMLTFKILFKLVETIIKYTKNEKDPAVPKHTI